MGWGKEVAVIVTLEAQPHFAPVPLVRVVLRDANTWDGGSPGIVGPDSLDGGSPSTASVGVDAGSPTTRTVSLPGGTDSVTLWWVSEGRTDVVPGAIQRPVGSRFEHLDVEAGFDVDTAYEVECFDVGQSIGRVALGSVRLPWEGNPDGCLVQQPLDPYLNAQVVNMDGSWPSLTWEAPGELVRPMGVSAPIVVGFGPRQTAQDVALVFGAPSREVSRRVRATLGTEADPQLPVWLIRGHQGLLPRRFYAHVKTLKETDAGVDDEGESWSEFSATVTEVARPAPGLQISLLSYDDLDVSYPSYDERDAAYASYDDMDTDWSLAGASG